MKRWSLLFLFLSVVVLLVGCTEKKVTLETNKEPNEHLLSVRAEGEVKTDPDVAYISVTVSIKKGDAKAAQQAVAETINTIHQDLEKLNVPKENISTESYSVEPVRVYSEKYITDTHPEPYKITGYKATNRMEVELTDLTTIGKVIDQVTKPTGVEIDGIRFGLTDNAKSKDEAVKIAVKRAQEKADVIAEEMGVIVVDVKTVVVDEAAAYEPYSYKEEMCSNCDMGIGGMNNTVISTKGVETKANVLVEFVIEKAKK